MKKSEIKDIAEVVGGLDELKNILTIITNDELDKICAVMCRQEYDGNKIDVAYELVLKTKNDKLIFEFIRRVGIGQANQLEETNEAADIFFKAIYDPDADIKMLIERLRQLNDPLWTVEWLLKALEIKEKERQLREKREQEREAQEEFQQGL